jgi:histidinol-phosphate aminotransferase
LGLVARDRKVLAPPTHFVDILTRMAPHFVCAHVRATAGYEPDEQPAAGERVVKLNTNENPFPPSPKVLEAIRHVEPELLRRYPSPLADAFRAAAAKLHGVTPEMIVCGNGSDDLLTIATRTFVPPGGALAAPVPTYALYSVLAQLEEAKFVGVDWSKDYRLPVEELAATKANAIYLANPNAPSGTFVPPAEVGQLCEKFRGAVLVDEAYADFADENCLALLADHENLVITRTLSKGYSLAGVRFGYAVAHERVAEQMLKVKDSHNCDAIAIGAAVAAIEDREHAQRSWEYVRAERSRVAEELQALGWTVLPSQANFLLATVAGGDGRAVYMGLKQQGILVRWFDQPGLRDKVRITIGNSQENNALLGGIRSLQLVERAA